MDYIELRIYPAKEEKREILISLLAEENFEGFAEKENELLAYIVADKYVPEKVGNICSQLEARYTEKRIPDQNWNAEWEKSFEPVLIAGKCFIRAPFHAPRPDYPFELIIEPKMSFGTAHHETTAMMIEMMMKMDFQNKKVLDIGCGTGILAILACKMGASEVIAIDNDIWAFSNALENKERNYSLPMTVKLGDVSDAGSGYDIILANINRNVLLTHIPEYSKSLKTGNLLLSGFYEEDLEILRKTAESFEFVFDRVLIKNRWIAARFSK
ncbi:MAG: 50S ribosomal protein L11 methyltransferase [Bacteroidales bacterium]|jgi:ribosomal protein L11 methyltransferase